MLELEGYTEATKEEVEKMESKLQHNLDHDLNFFAKDVKRLIADEIVKRYYSQQGSIVYALRDDADIAESLKLFRDNKKYRDILLPAKK